jgi:nitrogen fixation protein NifU and related proteins
MFEDLNDLYQQVILDHSKSPRNCGKLEGANRSAKGHNPLCGDHVTIYMRLENDRVEEIKFEGSGCAISKASASLLTDSLKGKSSQEARDLFEQVRLMVTTGRSDGETLGKLSVFAGVHKFPARVKCAILPWHAALAAVEGEDGAPVSTE